LPLWFPSWEGKDLDQLLGSNTPLRSLNRLDQSLVDPGRLFRVLPRKPHEFVDVGALFGFLDLTPGVSH
jgi:hypothetical protein